MDISNSHDNSISIAPKIALRIAQRTPVAIPFVLICVAIATSVSLAVFAAKSPAQDPGTRMFAEGLNIQLDKSSPAYAALEDIWTDLSSESAANTASEMALTSANVKTVNANLTSGSSSVLPLVEKIVSENRREDLLAAQERTSREAQRRADVLARNENVKKLAAQFTIEPRPADSQEPTQEAQATQPAAAPIEHPVQTISLASLHMTREELMRGLLLPIVKSIPPNSLPANVASKSIPSPSQQRQLPDAITSAESIHPTADHMGIQPINAASTQAPTQDPSATQPSGQSPYRQVMIAGSLEFTGGLAVANTLDRIVVFHEKDGETIESGAVWLREGRYEIFVDQAEGSLVGELRTPYGDILGRAEFDLSQFAPAPNQKTTAIPLRLHPVIQGIAGKVVGRPNPSEAAKRIVKNARVIFKDLPFSQSSRADGHFEEPNLLEGSTVITKTVRSGFYGSIAFARERV